MSLMGSKLMCLIGSKRVKYVLYTKTSMIQVSELIEPSIHSIQSAQYLVDFSSLCLCPIGLEVMDSPYTLSHCGHTFQQASILTWLRDNPKCPLCRVAIQSARAGFINLSIVEAIRIYRLLLKQPNLIVPLYTPIKIFVKEEHSMALEPIEVYVEHIVGTILIKYSIKLQKMAEFREGGQRMLSYKGKFLKNNLLIQDYNIQPFSILVYKQMKK